MSLYNGAFWCSSFFLIGVLLASVTRGMSLVLAACLALLMSTGLALFNRSWLAVLSLIAILGIGYFHWYAARHDAQFRAPLGVVTHFTMVVERVSSANESQQVTGELQPPYVGRIRVTAQTYPTVRYGDLIEFQGTLKPIEGVASGYFLKEGISATVSFPKDVVVVDHGRGSQTKATLFRIRDYVQQKFEEVFSPSQATLMTGLVLGKSGGFSKEFSEKLKATGTTHLVALSGYNISVVINSLLLVLGFVINRKYAVWFCIFAVIGFVIMTGAEASVVRAAIMATIMVIAERSSRLYSVRNAIAVTALVMTLFNPTILVFDIGFQLSFLALLGIIYLEPALRAYFRMSSNSGLFAWRTNVLTTTAAQLAVLPILLTSFGFFPACSIITNVLLLSVVPYTMGLGFFIILAGLLSSHLAMLVALPARALLGYELAVIDLFSRIPFGFEIGSLPVVMSIFYYLLVVVFIAYVRKHRALELPI